MALQMKINIRIVEDTLGGAEHAGNYLNGLKTGQVMFINGPESPGPCLRCLKYHRTIWDRGDFSRPRPPLHQNCYCRVVPYYPQGQTVKKTPVFKKDEYLQKKISNLSLPKRQILMGKGIARLHRLGIVETADLVKTGEGVVTLERHLMRKLGITRKQYAQMTDGQLIKRLEDFNNG